MTAIFAQQKPTSGASHLAYDDSILTMKTPETVAREIERQMYEQLDHFAIYKSDVQRLCLQLLEIGVARESYRCQSRMANWQCQKTVGHADLHFHNSFGSWPRRRNRLKPLLEKRKPQPTVRPEYRSQPDAPKCSKTVFGKVVPAKQRHAQSDRMKSYWRRRQAAGHTGRIKPH